MKGGKLGIGMGQAVRSPSDIENALVLLVTPGQWYGAAHTRQLRSRGSQLAIAHGDRV